MVHAMQEFTHEERAILVQYAIQKFQDEEKVMERLKTVLDQKEIQRTLDTLIGTQRVRRIGPDTLQNNESHTEMPDLPEALKDTVDKL